MRIAVFAAACAATTACVANLAQAQTSMDLQKLKDRDLQRLDKAPRKAYEEGMKALDHLNPTLGVEKLMEASTLAPRETVLHLLAARAALLRARRVRGSGAEEFFQMADEALIRAARQKVFTKLQKDEYNTLLKRVAESRQARKTSAQDGAQDGLTTRPRILPLLRSRSSQPEVVPRKVVVKDPIQSSRAQSMRDKDKRDSDKDKKVDRNRGNRYNRNRGRSRRGWGGGRRGGYPRGNPGRRPGWRPSGGGGGGGGSSGGNPRR